jgi:hypothetical protein
LRRALASTNSPNVGASTSNQFAWEGLFAITEFRAHAFHAAVAKARDLGWIVYGIGEPIDTAITTRLRLTSTHKPAKC